MYMTGPVGFIAGATVFWGVVHCIMRCRFRKTSAEKENEKILRRSSRDGPKRPTRDLDVTFF